MFDKDLRMSTSEKWTNDYSPCPCGKGKILEHVDSPDNPWSRISYDYSLECKKCDIKYILGGKELKNRKGHEEADEYFRNFCDIEDELTEICKEAIDEILKSMHIHTPKIEYQTLVNANLCSEGPIRYPRLRKAGKRASDLCQPLANIDWIINKLPNTSKANKIAHMKAEMEQFESKWRAARKKEKPIPISSLRKK